jgi:hypothetical protein
VHGADAVVVAGQDGVQGVGGGVFGAAVDLVDAGVIARVMLVGFVDDSRVDGQVVFVAAYALDFTEREGLQPNATAPSLASPKAASLDSPTPSRGASPNRSKSSASDR